MNLKQIYGYPESRGPLSPQQLEENSIDEQVLVEPVPSERALELQRLYGYRPGRGIQSIDIDPKPTTVTLTVLLSVLDAADEALADEALDEAGLRAAFSALRSALLA